MKNLSVATCLALLLLGLCLPGKAGAFSRAAQPLAVAMAQADAIVVARFTGVPTRPVADHSKLQAQMEVTRSLKGGLAKGSRGVQLNQMYFWTPRLQEGGEYVVFLSEVKGSPAEFEVMLDGTRLFDETAAREIPAMIAVTPAWAVQPNGLATCLVAEKYHLKPGAEVNLFVGCKNVSDKTVTLTYTDWPLATHSYWELNVAKEGGAKVAAEKHPHLTQQGIDEYFGKFHRSYDITLEPGKTHFYGIPRVNTAKPGWGYKEELDFKYYPMAQPGCWHLTATGHHFPGEIVAGGLRLWLE